MIEAHPITLINTGVPLAVLGGAAVILPRVLVGPDTRSHRTLAWGIFLSALGLIVLSCVVFVALYAVEGVAIGQAVTQAPLAFLGHLLQRSAGAVLLWGPILGLSWFGLAQRAERLRGEDGMHDA